MQNCPGRYQPICSKQWAASWFCVANFQDHILFHIWCLNIYHNNKIYNNMQIKKNTQNLLFSQFAFHRLTFSLATTTIYQTTMTLLLKNTINLLGFRNINCMDSCKGLPVVHPKQQNQISKSLKRNQKNLTQQRPIFKSFKNRSTDLLKGSIAAGLIYIIERRVKETVDND